jgi:hypothetical protein
MPPDANYLDRQVPLWTPINLPGRSPVKIITPPENYLLKPAHYSLIIPTYTPSGQGIALVF